MNRLAPSLAVLVLLQLATILLGQDEELQELDASLREVELEKSHLTRRIGELDERLQLLRQARKLRVAIGELELRIERAEDQDNEAKVNQLERALEPLELQIEEAFARLELLEHKSRLTDLQAEFLIERLDQLGREAEQLLPVYRQAKGLVAKLFEAYREKPESEGRRLEEQLESLQAEFERRVETLQLKLELHFAREEGDGEAIRDLEAELRTLGAIGEMQQRGKETVHLPKPIRLSEEEIASAATLSFDEQIMPVLKTHCYECHDGASAAGDLDLQMLVAARPLVVNRAHWINVIQQLKVRSMPPADARQPSEAERRTLAAFLTDALESFDYATVRQPGYESARRLTHEEYNNTLRDLFGIDLRPADDFPADLTASSGFENSANSLFIQPIMMERYIGAAERIVGEALPAVAQTPEQLAVRRRLLGGDSPREAVARFAARAFRRPADEQQLVQLLAHFDRLADSGVGAEEAFRQTVQIILVAPSFLMRTERDHAKAAGESFRVSEYELASRLSYFLWASMPDERLFDLAAEDALRQPVTLAAQVDRMLHDDKARTLGSIFASQWLGFSELDRVPRDQIDNPWATDSLVEAMHAESAMFFHALVEDNEPIERLVDADYTFVNEELANHYQIKGVRGDSLQRVPLEGTARGGVLGHGSILAITSYPRRTSPVLRGNWILTELLGTPPPPPPPNVSQFDERVAESRSLTQRQKLELHRSNANCYACHNEIDPLGFALARFDWFGQYRPNDHGKRIDATGTLPNGRNVSGLAGLRRALVDERLDDLVEQLARKMLSYALGRQLEYYDEATIREIIAKVEADGRRIQTLIHAIVQSDAFQMKQIQR